MKIAAKKMVRRMKLGDHPFMKVGVIEFNNRAQLRADLTNRESRVISGINTVRTDGGTSIETGIELGRRVLTTARDDLDVGEENIREFMIVISDGGNNSGCGPVLAAANLAKGQGIEMFSVCIGTDCADACMRQVASTPANYSWAEHSNELSVILEKFRQKAYEPTKLRDLHIVETLPENMRFVPGSAMSEPSGLEFSEEDSVLTWESRLPPDIGITVTYQIEPLQAGLHPSSRESLVRFWDDQRGEGALTLESPAVLALDPVHVSSATPTPTSTATPTITPLPTETPLPTATLTPTATATGVPVPIYLPVALYERCDPTLQRADIVLVLDTSSSMLGPKLEDAKSAAAAFVGLLELRPDRDQVAIVRFDAEGELVHQLSADRGSIQRSLSSLDAGRGTHVDAGLLSALDEMRSARRREANTPIIILLTDGIHAGEPGADREAAAAVRDAGIALYSIGLGADVDEVALQEMAGDSSRYYFAPDSSSLAEIYHEVAKAIECPPGRYWSQSKK